MGCVLHVHRHTRVRCKQYSVGPCVQYIATLRLSHCAYSCYSDDRVPFHLLSFESSKMERSSEGNTGGQRSTCQQVPRKGRKPIGSTVRTLPGITPRKWTTKFHLGPSVFKRWTSNFSKAKELGVSIAKLVEILLDGLDKASRPSITNPCSIQPSTSTEMFFVSI